MEGGNKRIKTSADKKVGCRCFIPSPSVKDQTILLKFPNKSEEGLKKNKTFCQKADFVFPHFSSLPSQQHPYLLLFSVCNFPAEGGGCLP